MKKNIAIFLLMTMIVLLLSACSFLDDGITRPNVKIDHTFENDKWLIIEDRLINKIDGTVHWLELNRDIAIPGVAEFHSDSANVYKYEFEESVLKQYTFLRVYPEHSGSDPYYYEYIITFNYDGKEMERSCISGLLTKTEMQKEHDNKFHDSEVFGFCVLSSGTACISGRFGLIDKENASVEGQIILDFAENLYKTQSNDDYYAIDGITKPIGDELWFSTVGSNRHDDLRGNPLISGISETKITSYDFETKEFKTIFEHNKKTQIIDFDENGAYVLDSNGNFGYVDFETKKTTEIYEFSSIDCIIITDKYICVKYVLNGYTYFVYEKDGSLIANDSSLD